MDDREQKLREKAYQIWEDEGRPEGLHDDHWRRAEEQHQDVDSDAVTQANREASETFNDGDVKDRSVKDIRPPSALAPD